MNYDERNSMIHRFGLEDVIYSPSANNSDDDLNPHTPPWKRKNKWNAPYSYSPFTCWAATDWQQANGTDYSDRLIGWDYYKYEKLYQKHLKPASWDSFAEQDPQAVEAFLREYHQKPNLRLLRISEYCNASNGYPLWRLDYLNAS